MAVAVLPRFNQGLRGLNRLGLGDTTSTNLAVANTPVGPEVVDQNGNVIYTATDVANNPSLASVGSGGCPSGLVPTYEMGGSVCAVPGTGAPGNTCDDPTGVCGSFLLPGQSLSQANQGWVMQGDGTWVWNGPGQPTTPSPGAINELTTTYYPTGSTAAPPATTLPTAGLVSAGGTALPLTSNLTQSNMPPAGGGASGAHTTPTAAPPTTSNTTQSVIQCSQLMPNCPSGQVPNVDANGCYDGTCINGTPLQSTVAPQNLVWPFIDYSSGIPTGGGSTTVAATTTTASCTGGFMDLFTAGCPNPLTTGEILIGVGVLAVMGFMMMGSGRR